MNRFERLLELYRDKYNEEPSQDDIYVMELITKLKPVYDHNFERIRNARNCYEKDAYLHKEYYLNTIGNLLRKFIGIHIVCSEDVEKETKEFEETKTTIEDYAFDTADMEEQNAVPVNCTV